ncbi:MAG: ABC transporter ATP-binding protein [Planctomycetota bacterium]|nr:ABC transporter ATP-binding protein [Planctomycetota bacterium]
MTAETTAPAVLEVENATRLFDASKGLDGVSLTLAPGTLYGLLGPNGAGKTSFIRAVCGRLRLTNGSVRLDGGDPTADRAARRVLGLVPQRIAIHQDLTVRENLEVLGLLAGVARERLAERVAWGLDWADLAPRADDLARTLSGGMQRRLNLVAGVLHEPRVLLLDEPTVGVDPDARLRLHALLEKLRDDGMALLLTTHDLDEAARLCDRIGFLVDGRMRAEGTLEELVTQSLGTAKHLELLLDEAPSDEAAKRLAALGLSSSHDPARWFGRREGGLGTLGDVERAATELGLGVRQATLVEPGLREVFLHVTGRELAS